MDAAPSAEAVRTTIALLRVHGAVTIGYDGQLRIGTMTVGAQSGSYQYDKDGLLRFELGYSITRHPQTGFVSAVQSGNLAEAYTYSRLAERSTQSATYSGTAYYSESVTLRDDAGRILNRSEGARTASGGTFANTDWVYSYDLRGRLRRAERNGVANEYVLDDNGNRLELRSAAGTVIGRYDEQDRLLRYCPETTSGTPAPTPGLPCFEYSYNDAGQLRTKTDLLQPGQTTTYSYDEHGALLQAALPGKLIDYELDAAGRRTGKRVNGIAAKRFLYWDELRPAAELDANHAVVSAFFYGTKSNVPDYVWKGSAQYRLVTDHLGSVRLVVNVSTGAIAQRLEYDEFGAVVADTNPGFQPFGFAGGLYDADTGLVRFAARDYDPVVGRWTAKDPILFAGGDTNLYAYVGNDPVNYIDPAGWMKLPANPSGLGPEWTLDPTHQAPNGQRWVDPNGNTLDWNPGNPSLPKGRRTNWERVDHWHLNGGKRHLRPGTEVDLEPICEEGGQSYPDAQADEGGGSDPGEEPPILPFMPLPLPMPLPPLPIFELPPIPIFI